MTRPGKRIAVPVAAAAVLAVTAGSATPRRLPRGFAPVPTEASLAARPAARVTAPTQKLVYFGGRVLSNAKIYAVNWGPGVATSISGSIGAFYAAVAQSTYFDMLSAEYGTVGVRAQDGSGGSDQRLGRGSFGGSFTITPTVNTTSSITDFDIQAELAAQLDAGTLPAPETDAAGNVNSLYMFDVPASVSIGTYNTGVVLQSCVDYGGYHGTIVYKGKSVAYGVHPDCNGGNLTFATIVHSHELAEAVTDPEIGLVDPDLPKGETRPCAWYSFINGVDDGEVGDLCSGQGTAVVGGYHVQNLWSNTQGACVASEPTIICDGATPAITGCRACTAADDGAACNGARPHCETNASSPKVGQCVECTSSAQCTAPNATCLVTTDDSDDTCASTAACATDADCVPWHTTPICDATTHACRACVDADCTGATPACEKLDANVNFGRCVQCAAAQTSACTGATPVCDLYPDVCKGCMHDADCGKGATCQLPAHTCLANAADGGMPVDAAPDAPADAAPLAEAGTDSGRADASSPDAASPEDAAPGDDGSAEAGDAATLADAGKGGGGGGGCGCRTAPRGATGPAGLGLLALLVLRRVSPRRAGSGRSSRRRPAP